MRSAPLVAIALLLLLGALITPGVRAPPPTLTILSPAYGAVIGDGADVIVQFAVADFTLVQPGRVGQTDNATEGHLAVFVDGVFVRTVTRVEPIVLPLASGSHQILLRLRGNDGVPLVPDVSASVDVTVTRGPAAGPPGVEILHPPYDLRTGHDVYLDTRVTNFTLVAAEGRPNAPNEGHLVVLLNGAYYTEVSGTEPAFLVDLPDGYNTFTVRLVNNDGTPLTPDVTASTRVFIKGANPLYGQLTGGGTVAILLLLLFIAAWRRLKGQRPLKKTDVGGAESEPVRRGD